MFARHERDEFLPDGIRRRAEAFTNYWVKQSWKTWRARLARRRFRGQHVRLCVIGSMRRYWQRKQYCCDDA
jgi:hypothetical protein